MLRRLSSLIVISAAALTLSALAADGGDTETLRRLPQAKHRLVDGIRQAEQNSGAPISAKFEYEDNEFWLSVYTAKEGLTKDAEHNTLMELKGPATPSRYGSPTSKFSRTRPI